jgi:hypothetical protein
MGLLGGSHTLHFREDGADRLSILLYVRETLFPEILEENDFAWSQRRYRVLET